MTISQAYNALRIHERRLVDDSVKAIFALAQLNRYADQPIPLATDTRADMLADAIASYIIHCREDR
jgi:hypothetical protein